MSTEPTEPILQFFEYAHLPPPLALISVEFYDIAHWIANTLPRNPERTTALRKLLEAKDCAVRAKLSVGPSQPPPPPPPTNIQTGSVPTWGQNNPTASGTGSR